MRNDLKVMIRKSDNSNDWVIFVPVYIPEFDDMRCFANELHSKRRPYKGEYKGWPVVYQPADQETPEEEWMIPFPARFQIGVWPLWAINFDWEEGDEQPPYVHTITDNLVIDDKVPAHKTVDELLEEISQVRERLGLEYTNDTLPTRAVPVSADWLISHPCPKTRTRLGAMSELRRILIRNEDLIRPQSFLRNPPSSSGSNKILVPRIDQPDRPKARSIL